MTDMVGRRNWDEPVLRLAAKDAMEIAVVMDPSVPSPADIAAFLDVVRRLNNSVTWGEVEPGVSVWKWLESLAG